MRFIYTKSFRRIFAIFILLAAFFIFDKWGYFTGVKSFTQNVFGSTSHAISDTGKSIKDFFAVIATLSKLAKENAQLNQKIDELTFENSRLQSAKTENITLRRALKFEEEQTYETIPAEVETQDPTGFSQTVLINKGESDGIVLGQSVIVSPGLLVGRISKVYSKTSEITLITDPSTTINAEVVDSGARGLLKGEHGISLILDLVTQNEVIKAGDKLITAGLAGDFPRGLQVGEISAIRSSSSDLFQQAFVTPTADLKNLRFVFIIQ